MKPDRAGLLMTGETDADKVMKSSLGYIDLMVYGKTIQALVDTGATHNSMTTRLGKEAGPTSTMEIKAVDSRAKVVGLVHDVPVQMKEWRGQLDFIVMEMNGFDMILGQDFLKVNKVIVVPFCDEDKLLQLGWTMEQGEIADCANKEEEAVIVEDVADMTMMEDELEDNQVELGSCMDE